MTIVKRGLRSYSDQSLDLDVETDDLTITVKAGSFRMRSEDLSLDEDSQHTVEPSDTNWMSVVGYLAKDTQDNDNIVVVVDEVLDDGDDEPMEWDTEQYKLVCPIYSFNLAPGALSLESETIIVESVSQGRKLPREGEEE